ncbi:MAG: hypothetical protein KUG81_02410 [Gammaproteobacteria bacterium]|nr:hypothetical protein [Gammaproteobacteria bacterium]
MRIFIVLLSLALFGCTGQNDMENIVKQMQHSYADGRTLEFQRKTNEILSRVEARDIEYLIANTGPLAMRELGEAGLRQYYQEKIFGHLSNDFEFSPKGSPTVTFDEADNIGYSFLYEAAGNSCTGVFKVVVISYSEKLLIRGLSFKNITSCSSSLRPADSTGRWQTGAY